MFWTVSVIGGDMRQLTVAKALKDEGFKVSLYGFDEEIEHNGISRETDIDYALAADIVVLPIPITYDGCNINMPYCDFPLSTEEFLDAINPSALVFGGQFKPDFAAALEDMGVKYCDLLRREELAIKNAVPTAEGAIKIAIEETPITLHGSRCLVAGYGRIGKILASMLAGLGANVYVEARKYADLAMIEGHGYVPLPLSDLRERIGDFDIIFNTVPHLIFDREILSLTASGALIIDLASKPGGVDFMGAGELGVKVIWALSLPGKIAPVTSGMIIKDTIMNILKELEV
ncbi:MAG: dipicolinate synthase subunit DpsA [Clostridiales bacterium]|nr:dipicolinate synthase subunit DpsA [Clostridiales bacterium]